MNVSVLCHNSKYTVEQKSLFLSGLNDLLLPKKKVEKKNSIQHEKLKRGRSLRKGRGLMYKQPVGGVISSDPPLAPPPPKQHHCRRVSISETCVCDYVVFSLVLRDKCVQKYILKKINNTKEKLNLT